MNSSMEDAENSPENSCGSPPTTISTDNKLIESTSSPRRSRRSIKKRVVSVPIKEVDGSRLKGEISNTPPSDSWAWRKYGQKPIKGSPYPRGYYRCSSSKGCPARKQVERNRDDPNMLLVTYSCEHNHAWPATRNNQKFQNNSTSSTTTITNIVSNDDTICKLEQEHEEEKEEEDDKQHVVTPNNVCGNKSNNDNKFKKVDDDDDHVLPLLGGGEFGWLSDFECTSGDTMLESQILTEGNNDAEMMNVDVFGGSIMREEDELLFADLGELPECSMVFGSGMIQRDDERRTPWCGTTG